MRLGTSHELLTDKGHSACFTCSGCTEHSRTVYTYVLSEPRLYNGRGSFWYKRNISFTSNQIQALGSRGSVQISLLMPFMRGRLLCGYLCGG